LADSFQSAAIAGPAKGGKTKAACGLRGCSRHAILMLDSRSLCLEHAISHCYSRLKDVEEGEDAAQRAGGAGAAHPAIPFLDECGAKLATVLVNKSDLANLERAQLLDIVLWANELSEKKRR